MGNLTALYNSINDNGFFQIRQKNEFVDTTIYDKNDTRMGLTLLIRPDEAVKDNLQKAMADIGLIEPNQYYYPAFDYHITLFPLISAVPDYVYTKKQKDDCIKLVRYVLNNQKPFEINMKGLILSDACIIAAGFPDESLNNIRIKIRENITRYDLVLKERYPLETAHITTGRFRQEIMNREDFLDIIREYRNKEFGTFNVREIELVYHNWFDSEKEILERFTL